jgi:hypothetical protein
MIEALTILTLIEVDVLMFMAILMMVRGITVTRWG